DGDRLGGVPGCRHSLRPLRYDEVHLEPDQLGRQVGQPVDPTLRISIVDDNILALNPPELAQPLPERVEQGRPIGRGRQPKETYPRHLARLLLRARRERPTRCRAAEQRDERAALHSTTSSARCCKNHGTSSPSALAVLRLMTRSNLVGRTTGKSPGLAPLRIRPA